MNTTPMIHANMVDIHNIIVNAKASPRKRGNPGAKLSREYVDLVTAYDIETSQHPDSSRTDAIMYIWQWQIDNIVTVYGRTWEEWRDFVRRINAALDARKKPSALVVLVHNLSYEFQFIRGIYDFSEDEVFALAPRRVAKCTMYDSRFEFRCTQVHSNMSLRQWAIKMHVAHQKLDGEDYDYSAIRYPDTPLTSLQMQYCQNDVIAPVECYRAEMEQDGDDLYSIPLTSTGYVRRDCKRAMRSVSHDMLKRMQPDEDLYIMLREAFRGGDTHANRHFAGKVLDNVKSADRSSSYPDVLCNCKFPMGKFTRIQGDIMDAVRLINRGYAVLMRVRFEVLRLDDPMWGFPYLSLSRCSNVVSPCMDNGRVLSAAELTTSITDIDFQIIMEQYQYDSIELLDGFFARYDKLPAPLTRLVKEYYVNKTSLKGVLDENGNETPLYGKSKAKLNAWYGLMAQDPVRLDITYTGDDDVFTASEGPLVELLTDNAAKSCLCYQWGVWTTAWARLRLQEGLRLASTGNAWAVYCDTDSVKYIGDVDWDAYNAERIRDSKRSGAYAKDPEGNTHYMGVFEEEKTARKFKTLGAKKYVTVYDDGKCHCTIAGVNKHKGGEELDSYGGIDKFREGFVFRAAGGTESVYNDDVQPHMEQYDGHKFEVVTSILIRESTYRIGITDDYDAILRDPDFYQKIWHHYRTK